MRGLAKPGDVIPGVELVEQLLCADNESSQSVRSEHNLAMTSSWRKKNVAVTKLKLRRLFRKIAVFVHPLASSLRYAEQLGIEGQVSGERKSLTNSVSGQLLPTAPFARQAA